MMTLVHFAEAMIYLMRFSLVVTCYNVKLEVWLGSRVAKALDLQLAGCEFNSRPGAVE